MNITDFAELQSHYTGANNKRKWIITNSEILFYYLRDSNFRPSILAKNLNTSYATVKRLLCSANLWCKVNIRKCKPGGRKRTIEIDKFGYRYAAKEFDYKNDRGEVVRKYEHHVIAEQKLGRKLNESEVVHHIDLDKLNNRPENLFICKDNKQHRLFHGNLERIAGEAVRKNIIKFHPDHGYYLDDKVASYD